MQVKEAELSERGTVSTSSALKDLRERLRRGDLDPVQVAEEHLNRANANAGRNVYLAMNREWTLAEAAALPKRFPDPATRPPLYGLPVSLKDCFDLVGFPTSAGSRFYSERNGTAPADSWVAAKLRKEGAVIIGKTHMQQLAFGITGENPDFGDCAQPRDEKRLTGGSSSGAAASVQEGSAVAAIGTDTGGSIRVPAAVCGLAGYRSSVGLGDWTGAAHLAESFDTLGWLFRDLRDTPLLANALLDVPIVEHDPPSLLCIGAIDGRFLRDCDADVLQEFEHFQYDLRSLGMAIDPLDSAVWSDPLEIFAPIQASEAAGTHGGFREHFEAAIAERLLWGASFSGQGLAELRHKQVKFRDRFEGLFHEFNYLIAPCAPMSALLLGADHSATRKRILRYTSPASLAGVPVVTIPLKHSGVQLIGPCRADDKLVAFAAHLGEILAGQPHN
ncbi:MAG: amidase [Acetobacteraceae bacterium]|nr:amidase [Acetobacteraceae bacterium]